MSNNNPLLSIVIPTKDRYYYLKHLIELIKSFNSKEIEIVVQDNTSDNKEIVEYLDNLNYPQLKYFHTKEQIPISLNSDLSIRNSTGQYVCFIGDDDGVTKYILDCCKWMKSSGIECVVPEGYSYNWPDANELAAVKGLERGGTIFWKEPSSEIRIVNTKDALHTLFKKGCTERAVLPLLYHAVVKRSALDKIWDTCGSYFPGASPDIANGVALALVIDKFAFVTCPVAFSGASKHLGGGEAKMKHRGTTDFKSLPFLPKNLEEMWDERVPKVWTAPTIWCQSSIMAFRAMHREDLVNKINYESMYEVFVVFYYYYRNLAYRLTNNKFRLFVKSSIGIIKRYWNAFRRLAYQRVFHKSYSSDRNVTKGLKNIIEVNNFLSSKVSPIIFQD